MRTIFVTCFHALIARNVLDAGVLKRLLAEKLKVVLIVPSAKAEYFANLYGKDGVIVEGVSIPKGAIEEAFQVFSLGLIGVENHIVRGWKTQKPLLFVLAHIVNIVFSSFFFLQQLMRTLVGSVFPVSAFEALIDTYHPDLVFTTDSFNREDSVLLYAAKRKKVKTAGMIRSWDNATTKGVFLSPPQKVLVTNEVLKEEMVAIHHIPASSITVTGIPHYDAVSAPPSLSREAFAKQLGLDPKKKWILYAPGGKILYEHDAEILTLFKQLVDDGAFSSPVQFIVRFPPGDTLDTSVVANHPCFVIDDPGTNVTGRKKDSELGKSDQEHLHNSLKHADMVLTLASTIIIDGMVYGKPVVVFGFDPLPNLPDPIEKFTRYVHLRKLLGSGLVTVSKSKEEFVQDMNDALKDPARDKAKQTEVIRRYTLALDGKSGERVATAVLAVLPS